MATAVLPRVQKNEDHHTQGNGKISFGRDPAQTKSGGKQTALRTKSLKKTQNCRVLGILLR
jgi:hypothetical protein